ncbi:MAG: acetyl-CoA carboxylase carboxyltransferase subunit alpha [Phycisphaeraceae bacterium]|nr:acetyl-CoA carboxylase carboxyltransferase subunit alpha [Phycisphaeraceae bacterium]
MSAFYQLEFERPVVTIERRIEQLERHLRQLTTVPAPAADAPAGSADAPVFTADLPAANGDMAVIDADDLPPTAEATKSLIDRLAAQRQALLTDLYRDLSPWNTVRVARHPNRPQSRDYIEMFCKDFCELHGDRRFGDDPAMVTGFGRIGSIKCLIVGHHKGRTTKEKIACHFGCAHPEGYRKALAKMKLAEKFGLPIVTLVDTPGAYPGVGAEERGQAEAIAVNLREMSRLKTPIVSIIIGEGGSGGALGIAVADRVGMLSNSWYSVISPEGCAAILWKQANEQTNTAAADSLKLTARDNLDLGIVDSVIPEPLGGAHRDPKAMARTLERWITDQLQELRTHRRELLPQRRYERFRALGAYVEAAVA